jgi:hypothetical protein
MKILEVERWRKGTNPHEVVLLRQQQEKGKIGSAITQETRSVSSPAAKSLRGKALAQILPPNIVALHPGKRRPRSSVYSV